MSGEGHLAARPLIEAPLRFRLNSGGRTDSLICCPSCSAPAFIRRSQRVTELVKHIEAHCTNTGCGHTFLMELAFVHSFNPGLVHRPDLNLKQCPRESIPHILPPAREGPDDDPDQLSMFDAA